MANEAVAIKNYNTEFSPTIRSEFRLLKSMYGTGIFLLLSPSSFLLGSLLFLLLSSSPYLPVSLLVVLLISSSPYPSVSLLVVLLLSSSPYLASAIP